MIKPKRLQKGDTVAIVSLSSGSAGEDLFRHRYEQGKKRLEEVFGLKVKTMPNALKGCDYISKHPEARAKDFMDALKDKNVKGIICNIGGDDTIRLLPYIDFNVIKNNPKIFMGYSDSTVNHFMMYKAGVTSYYGPAVMCEFAENYEMHEYTKKYIKEVLFDNKENITITSSPEWTSEFLDWCHAEYDSQKRKMVKDSHGYEIIQGKGTFEGELLGGCFDVFPMMIGTDIWPKKEEWKNKILFLETSEDEMPPSYLKYYLRNLIAQGVINEINGIIIGKPQNETYYEEYKEIYKKLISEEANRPDLPILYNINIGHTAPMCILPLGQKVRVDLDNKKIIFLEKPMSE
jgi:muramoyltetrapeptide carboxypeptidase LdcA involved in peptidoglycan recycling